MSTYPLVSTQWLADRLNAPDVRVVDASWYLPQDNRDPRAEYRAAHIPGAVFFDLDDIVDTASPYPHMLPPSEKFSSRVGKLGLGDGNRIIVYDGGGVRSAARVWWMFKVFGCRDVAVLDGGFHKWRAEGRPVEDLPPLPRDRHFTARRHSEWIRGLDDMRRNVISGEAQVVDARSAGRFAGTEPEPRPGLKSGHIPGAFNVPNGALFDAEGCFLPPDKLRSVFEEAGVDLTKPIITSCGSGITAANLFLALTLIGVRDMALYDGSWAEWGAQEDTPTATV